MPVTDIITTPSQGLFRGVKSVARNKENVGSSFLKHAILFSISLYILLLKKKKTTITGSVIITLYNIMYFVRYKCMSPSEKFHYIYSQTRLSIVKYQRLSIAFYTSILVPKSIVSWAGLNF